MEVQQEEERGSSPSTGLIVSLLIVCIGGFFYYGGFSSLKMLPTLTANTSSSCNQVASGYTAHDWALEACQDAISEGISGRYFARQIYQESGFDPNVVSSSGDVGIAQFQPATARGLGIDPYEPHGALRGAAHLMSGYYQQYGDYAKALAAYNSGSGTVNSAMRRCGGNWQACLPAVTQRYITTIMQ